MSGVDSRDLLPQHLRINFQLELVLGNAANIDAGQVDGVCEVGVRESVLLSIRDEVVEVAFEGWLGGV